jgi:hypothetical protein
MNPPMKDLRSPSFRIPARTSCIPLLLLGALAALPGHAAAATITRPSNDLGLVSYWTMDGGDMNWATGQLTDRAGSFPMSAITLSTSTTPALGKIGQAFGFTQNGYLNSVSAYTALNGSTGLTVCGWVNLAKLGSTDPDDGAVFTVNSSDTNSIILWYNTNVTGTDHAHAYTFNVGDTADGPGRVNSANFAAIANVWQHVCGVMAGSARRIYVDGSLSASTSGAVTTSYTNANTASIGNWSNGTNYLMNGAIDDVRVYNRALSSAEISELYGKGAARVSASSATLQAGTTLANGLNGYWTFDGVDTDWSTNKVTDRSNGTTDTMTSFATTTASVPGKLGQALRFNGATSYINTGAWNSEATAYTVSLWFKFPPGSSGGIVFTRGDSSRCFYNPSITVNSNGLTTAETGCGGSGAIATQIPIDTNGWNHVVEVRSGSSNTTYLNGAVVATRSYTPDCSDCTGGTSRRVQIGASWHATNGVASNYGGQVDDVRTYNRALSASEVQQLYHLGAATANASSATLTSGSSLSSGLLGYWTLDGSDTNWATGQETDKSGNGNTGTLVSLSTTTSPAIGKIGQALSFDGTSRYISVPTFSSLNPDTNDFTIALWVKPKSVGSTDLINTSNNNAGSFTQGFGLGIRSTCLFGTGGNINFNFANGTTRDTGTCSTNSIPANVWSHVVISVSRGDTISIYLNGVLDKSVSTSLSGAVHFSQFTIGKQTWLANYNGSMDDIRFYNRALSAAEAKQLYNLGK